MDEQIEFQKEIVDELNSLYGIEDFRNTIVSYIEYINLRKQNKIRNLGNYNLFITVPEYFNYTEKIVDVICKILKHYDLVKSNYYQLSERDIRHKKIIKEDVIVIDADMFNIKSSINEVQKYIQNNSNKIYIAFMVLERNGYLRRFDIEDIMINEFSFYTEIAKELTKEEKQNYIKNKLNTDNITVATDTDFVQILSKKDIRIIDKELLYLTIKSKVTNTDKITNEFLEDVNRPQYINKTSTIKQNKKTAMQELDGMVGLENVKKQIKQIVNSIKMNKSRGNIPMLHMIFQGNPGSGKTEIARIIGKIFEEEKILNEGTFIEVSRPDLVGKYIGHTASQTKEFIEKAKGGVLFIDEAYSLNSKDSTKDFGKEAISTLIKYMEDYRDDLCVILAGYTDDMQELLKSNKGFESRINFKIQFNDYNAEELYSIFKVMAKRENYKIDYKIKNELIKHFEIALKQDNFSNGRYVRNIFEKIKLEQADRVSENKTADKDTIKLSDVRIVIQNLEQQQPKEKMKIGFNSTGCCDIPI